MEMPDNIKDDLDKFIKTEVNELINVLEKKHDIILIILRYHLLSESVLERIIHNKLKRADRLLENAGLSYIQKLLLVDSFDLVSDSVIQSLKNINRLRNICAHVKDQALGTIDIDLIGRPFGKKYTNLKREKSGDMESTLIHVLGLSYSGIISSLFVLEHGYNKR